MEASELQASERRNNGERKTILTVVSVASFLTPFLSSSLNLSIPAIGAELGASAVTLSWVVTGYLVASAALLVPFGRLGDVIGRRRVFMLGMLVQAGFSLACGFASSLPALIVFRVLQGAGGGMAFATSMAILISAFPLAERGRVIGISTAAVYVGLSLGPVLGGLITYHIGWRAIFLVCAGLGLLMAVLIATQVRREDTVPRRGDYDVAGAALYSVSLLATMTGISTWRTWSPAPWLFALGFALLTAFIVRELRASHPTLDLRLFRNVVFAFSNLAALIHYSATFAVGFLLSLYLQSTRGLDARQAGLVLLAQPILMAFLSPWAGRLSDRVEPRRLASLGMLLTVVALTVFANLGVSTSLGIVIAVLMLIGVGFALFSSPNSNAVMSSVTAKDYGVASATLGTMRLVGQALSMALVAVILAVFMADNRVGRESAPELLASVRTAFTLFAVFSVIGTLASLARGRVRPNQGATTILGRS